MIWAFPLLANFQIKRLKLLNVPILRFFTQKRGIKLDEKFFYDLPLSLLGIYSVITARNFRPWNLLDFSFKPKSTGIIIFILYSNDTKANLLELVQCRKQIGKKNYSRRQNAISHYHSSCTTQSISLSWNEIKMKSGILLRELSAPILMEIFYSRNSLNDVL